MLASKKTKVREDFVCFQLLLFQVLDNSAREENLE